MAYPPETRAAVRAAYIYPRLPLTEAAAAARVQLGRIRTARKSLEHFSLFLLRYSDTIIFNDQL